MHDELVTIFGDSHRSVTKEDLDNMQYLKRVIKETMRIFPFGPLIARTTTEDLQLSNYSVFGGKVCCYCRFFRDLCYSER